jgi:hypothetical protein
MTKPFDSPSAAISWIEMERRLSAIPEADEINHLKRRLM